MKKYSAIILAAGYSSRMGNFKPIMDMYGKTPISKTIDLFKQCGVYNIIVVTGHLSELIENQCSDRCQVVFNKDYDKGMYSSVKAGVAAISEDTDAFFILPADIPAVKNNTIKKMMDSFQKIGKGILFPIFSEEKGHPVLMSHCFSEEILSSDPKEGLREILNNHKQYWNYEKVADRGILLDMDTKEDFEVLLEHVSKDPYPDEQECMEILRLCNVRSDAAAHMKTVSKYALKVAQELNKNDYRLNEDAIYSGALLHDVAKGEKAHAKKGAEVLEDFGYGCLKEIVSQHMKLDTNELIGEKEIVYICDKLIKGTEYVTLEERFKEALVRYKNVPAVFHEVNNKLSDAKKIKEKIEEDIGKRIEMLR